MSDQELWMLTVAIAIALSIVAGIAWAPLRKLRWIGCMRTAVNAPPSEQIRSAAGFSGTSDQVLAAHTTR